MGKKLSDIEKEIKQESNDFYLYLKRILSEEILDFLSDIKKLTNVYLFSGVTRNYFLNRKNERLRDIDFIIEEEIDFGSLFPNYKPRKNSFGGYKIEIDGLTIDLWQIEKTWGLNHGQLSLDFSLLESLPKTTFFNFSSIIYSLNDRKFIVGKPFLKFLYYKKLDIVLEANPLPSLCIVNTFYYSDKYNLKLSDKLVEYIMKNYSDHVEEFDNIQLKHFGEIKYNTNKLLSKIRKITPNKVSDSITLNYNPRFETIDNEYYH